MTCSAHARTSHEDKPIGAVWLVEVWLVEVWLVEVVCWVFSIDAKGISLEPWYNKIIN